MAMDLQQPLSWFAGKPQPGNGPTQHGYRRDHTRYETETSRVILQAGPIKNGGITPTPPSEFGQISTQLQAAVHTQKTCGLTIYRYYSSMLISTLVFRIE